jgi:hypothetical protein
MALSERRFAAQILTPQGPRYYDDLGCALMAQDKEPELKNYPLFVVPDGVGAWQKADSVRYAPGMKTPMGYGYGAVAKGGTLSLAEVKSHVLQHQQMHAQHQGVRHD